MPNNKEPKFTKNDIHVISALGLLPFRTSAYILEDHGLNLKINGVDSQEYGISNIKDGDLLSFDDANGSEVEFELLLSCKHEEGIELAMFRDTCNDKIIITYPGLNNKYEDRDQGTYDYLHPNGNSVDIQYVKGFNDAVVKILDACNINKTADNILCVSNSSGDGELLVSVSDLESRYGICTQNLMINPWDISDCLEIALKQSVEKQIADGTYNKDQIDVAVNATYADIASRTTTVYGQTGLISGNVLNWLLSDHNLFDQTIRIGEPAGHTVMTLFNLPDDTNFGVDDDHSHNEVENIINKTIKNIEKNLSDSKDPTLSNRLPKYSPAVGPKY